MLALLLFLSDKEVRIVTEALEHLYNDIFSGLIKPKSYTFYDIIDLDYRIAFNMSRTPRSQSNQ